MKQFLSILSLVVLPISSFAEGDERPSPCATYGAEATCSGGHPQIGAISRISAQCLSKTAGSTEKTASCDVTINLACNGETQNTTLACPDTAGGVECGGTNWESRCDSKSKEVTINHVFDIPCDSRQEAARICASMLDPDLRAESRVNEELMAMARGFCDGTRAIYGYCVGEPYPRPSPSASPRPSTSPTPTVTVTPSSSPTPRRSPTPIPTPTRSPTPSPTRVPTPTPTRSASPSPTPTRTPTPTSTRSPSPSPRR